MEFVVVGILLVVGYGLGIIGFFRAGVAMSEVRALRLRLERGFDVRQGAQRFAPVPIQRAPAPELAERESLGPETAQPEPAKPETAEPVPVEPVPAEPELASAPRPADPRSTVESLPDLENVLTSRWAVRLGAVALMLAGIFLIRYGVEQGLLGPAVRCGLSALLGAALLASAEWLRRREFLLVEAPFALETAPSALAAGGVAVLFGAAYGAGPFYQLMPGSLAFAAMAAASFLGFAAALRFGPLTAAVGILGAFATPALVAAPSPSIVGLFAYLALVTAAAYEIVWRTAWVWLGVAVAGAGAAWIMTAGAAGGPDLWAVAVYGPFAAFLGLLLPSAALGDADGRMLAWGQFAILAAAGLTLEASVPGLAPRLAILALAPIAVWKGLDEPVLDRLPWLAAAFGLAALALWDHAAIATFFRRPISETAAQPLLFAGSLLAIVHLGVGLWVESRAARNPINWSVLAAAVPVLALALCYALVGRFETDIRWGGVAVALALVLIGAAKRAVTADARERAGVHAAGAVVALTLALGMMFRDLTLTLALALLLPGLGWVESKVPLPLLRKVAGVIAAGTLALVLRWPLLALVPVDPAAPLIEAYGLPALAFFAAAMIFRRNGTDALVATLEAGAAVFASLLVVFQIRLWFGHETLHGPFDFDEIATLMLAFAVQALAYDRLARRVASVIPEAARALLAGAATTLAIGLLVFNPMVTEAAASDLSLVLAYLAPAGLAAIASRDAARHRRVASGLKAYAVLAGFAWLTLEARLAFDPDSLWRSPVVGAELWTWSGLWLLYGSALMGLGIAAGDRQLRRAAIGLVALVCVKVFLWDMADLTGLWRVASFLGLGLSLIGLSAMHRRFVTPPQPEPAA